MKPSNSADLLRALVLGAVSGLLFGVAFEMARKMWIAYEIRRAEIEFGELGMSPPLIADALRWQVVPTLCIILFALVSLIVHRLWSNRRKSVFLIWQVVGAAAVTVSFLFVVAFVQRIDLELIGAWLFGLALASLINLIYGAVIILVVAQYSQGKKTLFP